jgi:hypothetical protein
MTAFNGHCVRRSALALGAAASLLALAGCQQAPRGDSGGQMDPYERTRVDANSPQADTVNLYEFSDRVGEALAQRIADIDEITTRPSKVVIEMGSIRNDSPSTPSSDFRLIQRRVFTKLVNSNVVSKHASIVEQNARVNRDIQDTRPSQPDLLDERLEGTDQADVYSLDSTYILTGTFGEMLRGRDQRNYYFEMALTHAKSRRIVFVETFDSKQKP